MTSLQRVTYSRRETAESIGVSVDSVIRAEKRGELRTVRVGGRVLVPAEELERIAKVGLAPSRRQARAGR